jgi:hypothetical protein
LQWENGPAGKGPIVGYYIESRKKGKTIFLARHFINKALVVVAGGGSSSTCLIFLKF